LAWIVLEVGADNRSRPEEIMNACTTTHLNFEPVVQVPIIIVTSDNLYKVDRSGMQAPEGPDALIAGLEGAGHG
jgi:hypothetical protein